MNEPYEIGLTMEKNATRKFSINLSFEEIRLPPFEDVLILGKKNAQGKMGLTKSFDLLVPNEFQIFDVEDKAVEAVFINKRILKKLDERYIIPILKEKVFPFVSESEILKVDLKLKIFYDSFECEF